MNVNDNRMLFLRWVAKTHPQIFAQTSALVTRENLLGELSGWGEAIVAAIGTIGSTLIAKKAADSKNSAEAKANAANNAAALQTQLLQVNLQRAQAGQPPVDINGKVIPGASLPIPQPLQSYYGGSNNPMSSIDPMWLALGAAGLLGVFFLVRK
jgi:hypothetical protein